MDASIRAQAYVDVPYPFILGNGVAGIVHEVGSSVTRFKKGDRVVSDTPTYQLKETKYGGWQKYVVSNEATTAKIPASTTFEDAAAIPFALLTAVSALHLHLGMEKPGANCSKKALLRLLKSALQSAPKTLLSLQQGLRVEILEVAFVCALYST